MAVLTLAQLQAEQALVEGYQFGPQPELNPANQNVQAVSGHPVTPSPTTIPNFYPTVATPILVESTPNLSLQVRGMDVRVAENFIMVDTMFPGGAGAGVPVVQSELTAVNTTVPHTITETARATTLYAISLFMQALGTGGAGDTITVTISYVSPAGPTPLTITIVMHLDTVNVVMETYPLLVAAGTPISMSSAYGGAYADPYTISCKLVEMP